MDNALGTGSEPTKRAIRVLSMSVPKPQPMMPPMGMGGPPMGAPPMGPPQMGQPPMGGAPLSGMPQGAAPPSGGSPDIAEILRKLFAHMSGGQQGGPPQGGQMPPVPPTL